MNDYSHDIELGHPHLSDAPPSPGAPSESIGASTSSTDAGHYMRTSSGRRIDRRLCVFVMSAVFTLTVLVFAMAMICWRYDIEVWLPVITFAVGVWTGQLPTGDMLKSRKSSRARRSAVPA